MYFFEEMVELGLHENQTFPSDAHRTVAVNLAIANPNVRSKAVLTNIVQEVLKIPANKIKKLTLQEARELGIVY